ncbi:MAG: hypothetical protein AMJ88_14095 [Anaerolineae bacterium SM23_ 63]|nr:MAG: hypothetical protein AMJ88_14095 [Anaerolineae bacterium SM23_ 63]
MLVKQSYSLNYTGEVFVLHITLQQYEAGYHAQSDTLLLVIASPAGGSNLTDGGKAPMPFG